MTFSMLEKMFVSCQKGTVLSSVYGCVGRSFRDFNYQEYSSDSRNDGWKNAENEGKVKAENTAVFDDVVEFFSEDWYRYHIAHS